MEPWVIQTLASIIGGGLAGGALTIGYNWWTAKQKSAAQEKATIAALVSELKHIRRLCDFNARIKGPGIALFVRFPTTVSLKATFEERHLYPRLKQLHQDLESLVLGVIQVNQLIDLHKSVLVMPSIPGGLDPRPELCSNTENQIRHLCSGQLKVENVGPENFIVLPTFTDVVLKRLEKLMQ